MQTDPKSDYSGSVFRSQAGKAVAKTGFKSGSSKTGGKFTNEKAGQQKLSGNAKFLISKKLKVFAMYSF